MMSPFGVGTPGRAADRTDLAIYNSPFLPILQERRKVPSSSSTSKGLLEITRKDGRSRVAGGESARVSERERRLGFLQSSRSNHGNNQHSRQRLRRRRRRSQSRRVDDGRAQKTTLPCARRGNREARNRRTGRRSAKHRSRTPSCRRWR